MTVPPPTDPRWSKALSERRKFNFEFLATNMVFTRLAIDARRDTSKENLNRLSREIWELFEKNGHNPKVQNDLKLLFG